MSHNDRLFAVASLIATLTFLRGGEFTTNTQSTREVLRGRDVRVSELAGRRNVTTSIPKPKNAWWLESVDARCFDTGGSGEFSPVLWLLHYREYSSVSLLPDEAAFRTDDGVTITRDWMVTKTCWLFTEAGIVMIGEDGKAIKIKASSWRAGGARSATKAGLAGPLIMALGRWRSIAWGAYVAYSVRDLECAAQQMWSVSGVAAPSAGAEVTAPEAALLVGVPPRYQDDAIDLPRLKVRVRTVAHRRAGRKPPVVSVSRQCG
jgi:hypothetical protein